MNYKYYYYEIKYFVFGTTGYDDNIEATHRKKEILTRQINVLNNEWLVGVKVFVQKKMEKNE